MAVQESNVIDIVTYNSDKDRVMLVMVETREWGDRGALLPELQAKLNTYLGYALDGQMACDYPAYASKPVRIELRTQHQPTSREQQFLDIVAKQDLQRRGIGFGWRLIGSSPPQAKKSWWRIFG